MGDSPIEPLPSGVRAIAALFALCGSYLGIVGVLMLLRPGSIAMAAGAPLLFGLELAGPYMFLLMSLVGLAIAWGPVRRINLVRRIAMLVAVAGVAMSLPSISSAAMMVHPRALIFGGLGIIVRVIVAWYLSRSETVQQFHSLRLAP